jgi:hypothetical protein
MDLVFDPLGLVILLFLSSSLSPLQPSYKVDSVFMLMDTIIINKNFTIRNNNKKRGLTCNVNFFLA